VELVVDQLYDDPEVHLEPTADWRDFLSRLAYGVRRTALNHRRAFPLVATRPPEAPWIRPPLRSLRLIEAFVSGLRSRDFDEDATVYAYRAFTRFLLGYLLLETGALAMGQADGGLVATSAGNGHQTDGPMELAARMSPSGSPATNAVDGSARLDAEQYPTIAALSDRLADNRAEDEFRDALADLLDRIERKSGHPSG
jgi:hypothetical protein